MRFLPCLRKKKPKTPVIVRPIEEVEEEMQDQPTGRKLVGIDIYWRDVISDWSVLAKHIDFMFIKATEGDWRDDPDFTEHRALAKANRIPCGFYHFYRSNKSPESQARDLIRVVGSISNGELPVVCDWETEDDPRDGNDASEVKRFLDIIEAHFKVTPIIYSGSSFIKNKNLSADWTRYPLWVAHYTTADRLRIPKPWSNYTFWQNSSTAIVDGMGKKVDHNYFYGSKTQLVRLMK